MVSSSCDAAVPCTLLGALLSSGPARQACGGSRTFLRDYAQRGTNALLWVVLLAVTWVLLRRLAALLRLWAIGSSLPSPLPSLPTPASPRSAAPAVTSLFPCLKNIKVPDGYASNISRCVCLKERKIINLKSHDCHILMQDILPIALRASMPKDIVHILSRLSSFFKSLYSKSIDPKQLDQLQKDIVLILCDMEKIFPPGFFTIMVHLLIHLTEEVKLGGPVHYRDMYPIERYLMRLKGLVRNKAHPEGSIAEGYLTEETLIFCSRYMKGVEPLFQRTRRNDDGDRNYLYLFSSGGRELGKAENAILDEKSLQQAHRYVLLHSDKISAFRSRFLEEQIRANPNVQITASVEQKWIIEKFSGWLQDLVPDLLENDCSAELVALAQGPNNVIKRYKGYLINGFRFHSKEVERSRKTQNSGVVVMADGNSFYGVLTDIVELDYYGNFKVVLFRCDWANISRGLKKDTYGCSLVNFSRLIHTGQNLKDDPFIFSSQAKQVFYVQDPKTKQWYHIITTKPRDMYDAGSAPQDDEDDSYPQCESENIVIHSDSNDCSTWTRTDIEGFNV